MSLSCLKELDKYLEYDETASPTCLRWKVSRGKARAGDVAGSVHKKGYFRVRLFRNNYLVHRVVYQLEMGDLTDEFQVDHIDGDRSNNKISNLRIVDCFGQSQNLKMYSSNSSGVTGVRFARVFGCDYYQAYWSEDKKRVFKQFSCDEYTHEGAKELAVLVRKEAIDLLNRKGSTYTVRHGL